MVVFKQVEINNFLAIKEASLELDGRGLILIEGENKSNESFHSNGSGKSTLISAITYALYGKTEKGLKADDVVNNIEKKNTRVKLIFDIGEDTYTIERYRKDKENKNKVKLFVNDKEITGSTNDVTDKQIQELFGIEFNTYVNAIMYGQGDIPMFSQATDKGKKEILESITKTDIYKQAQDVAKEKVVEVEQEQSRQEQEIDKLYYQQELKEEQYNKDLTYFKQVMEQKAQEEKQIEEAQQQAETKRQQLQTEIDAVKGSIPKVSAEEHQYSDTYKQAQDGITKIETAIREQLQPKEREVNNSISGLNYNITSLQSRIAQLDTSETCPVCGAPIDNSHKVQEQANLQSEINSTQTELDTLKQALNVIQGKNDELAEKINKLKGIINQEEQEKQSKDRENQQKLQNQQSYYQKISELEHQMHSIQVPQLKDYSHIKEPNKEQFEEEQKELNKTIDKHKESIVHLESKKEKYNQAVNAFSNKGIRSVVLDFITPFLNEKANEYLQTLAGSDIEIEFQTQVENAKGELKDKFDVIVKNSKGGGSYKSNSAGEQKRIDLAISFAIQDLIMSKEEMSTNIALYDECFDGLDTVGCENVIKLLKDRLETVGTIFVITHNQSLAPLFEQTIKIIKKDGVSKLEENK